MVKLTDFIDHGVERVSFKLIMNRLGSGSATKTELNNVISKPYLFSNEQDARNFIEYLIGLDCIPVKYQNGSVFRTDIYN